MLAPFDNIEKIKKKTFVILYYVCYDVDYNHNCKDEIEFDEIFTILFK